MAGRRVVVGRQSLAHFYLFVAFQRPLYLVLRQVLLLKFLLYPPWLDRMSTKLGLGQIGSVHNDIVRLAFALLHHVFPLLHPLHLSPKVIHHLYPALCIVLGEILDLSLVAGAPVGELAKENLLYPRLVVLQLFVEVPPHKRLFLLPRGLILALVNQPAKIRVQTRLVLLLVVPLLG